MARKSAKAARKDPHKKTGQPLHKTVLHVDCGPSRNRPLHRQFAEPQWQLRTQDANGAFGPDHICDTRQLKGIAAKSMDAIWSCWSLMRYNLDDAQTILKSCHRVLKPEGYLIAVTANIEGLAEIMMREQTGKFSTPFGPRDLQAILYGAGTAYEHRSIFTPHLLGRMMEKAGFLHIRIRSEGARIWAVGTRASTKDERSRPTEYTHSKPLNSQGKIYIPDYMDQPLRTLPE